MFYFQIIRVWKTPNRYLRCLWYYSEFALLVWNDKISIQVSYSGMNTFATECTIIRYARIIRTWTCPSNGDWKRRVMSRRTSKVVNFKFRPWSPSLPGDRRMNLKINVGMILCLIEIGIIFFIFMFYLIKIPTALKIEGLSPSMNMKIPIASCYIKHFYSIVYLISIQRNILNQIAFILSIQSNLINS